MQRGSHRFAIIAGLAFTLVAPAQAQDKADDRKGSEVPKADPIAPPKPPVVTTRQIPPPAPVAVIATPPPTATCMRRLAGSVTGGRAILGSSFRRDYSLSIHLEKPVEQRDGKTGGYIFELREGRHGDAIGRDLSRFWSRPMRASFYLAISSNEFATIDQAQTYEFRVNGKKRAAFSGQSLLDAAKAAEPCVERQQEYWRDARPPGEAAGTARSKPVARDKGNWFRANSYPSRALREELQGTAVFALDVDEYGWPTQCRILQSTGHATLDQATCRIAMRRARFYPSRGEGGVSIPGEYTQKIRWEIPD